jgi:hypothetical protein
LMSCPREKSYLNYSKRRALFHKARMQSKRGQSLNSELNHGNTSELIHNSSFDNHIKEKREMHLLYTKPILV